MSDDTMAQDGFEPRPEIETPAPDADPVEALVKENADLKDRLLRLAAEMENLRKRMGREIEDTRSYAITKFARDMLTATDSLSRALIVLPAEIETANWDDELADLLAASVGVNLGFDFLPGALAFAPTAKPSAQRSDGGAERSTGSLRMKTSANGWKAWATKT